VHVDREEPTTLIPNQVRALPRGVTRHATPVEVVGLVGCFGACIVEVLGSAAAVVVALVGEGGCVAWDCYIDGLASGELVVRQCCSGGKENLYTHWTVDVEW
jgi:hypothetical protein